jgi:hypothetical protein
MAVGRKDARTQELSRRPLAGCQLDQVAQVAGQETGDWPRQLSQPQRLREAARVRKQLRDRPPQRALAHGPAVVVLDVGTADIDQMGVVHLYGAGRHAGQAGQAAIEVMDGLGRRRAALFEHGADEVDAAARRVILVAE